MGHICDIKNCQAILILTNINCLKLPINRILPACRYLSQADAKVVLPGLEDTRTPSKSRAPVRRRHPVPGPAPQAPPSGLPSRAAVVAAAPERRNGGREHSGGAVWFRVWRAHLPASQHRLGHGEPGARLSFPPPLPAAPAGRAGSRTGAPSPALIRALPTWSSLGVQFPAACGSAREILPLSVLTARCFARDPRAMPRRRCAARTGRTATAGSRRGLAGVGSGAQGGCPNPS